MWVNEKVGTHVGTSWFDEAAGPLVRPYALTRGRTGSHRRDVDMLTVLVTPEHSDPPRRPEPEYTAIVRRCAAPQSVAEVAAALQLPLAVTKILVSDLIGDGQLIFRAPVSSECGPGDFEVLRAVLDGIRKI